MPATIITTYKLRAETTSDLRRIKKDFTTNIEDWEVVEPEDPFGDITATFKSGMDLLSIQRKIGRISDCHVAQQTVQPIELYTGNRNYDLEVEDTDEETYATLSGVEINAVVKLDVRCVLGEKYVLEIETTATHLDDMLMFYGKKSKDELKTVYKHLLKDCAVISNFDDYVAYYHVKDNHVISKWRRDVLSMCAVRYYLLGVTPVVSVPDEEEKKKLEKFDVWSDAWKKVVSHIRDKNYEQYSKDVAVFHLWQDTAISTPEFVGLSEETVHCYFKVIRNCIKVAISHGLDVKEHDDHIAIDALDKTISVKAINLPDKDGNVFYAMHVVHPYTETLEKVDLKGKHTALIWYKVLFNLDVKEGEIFIFKGEKRRNKMYEWLTKLPK
jgi:hypothetical protein